MINPKIIAAFLCGIFLSIGCFGQDSTFIPGTLSKPTNLPLSGWNRVLQMRNGRTIVLHIAPSERLVVKVFDSAHIEVASVSQLFKVVSEKQLYESSFKGFYEIGGRPTLFIEQLINGWNALIRISFVFDGKIYDEIIMCQPEGNVKREQYFVSKSHVSDNYSILRYKSLNVEGVATPFHEVSFWDGKHKRIKKSAFKIPDLYFISQDLVAFDYSEPAGTHVAIGLCEKNKLGNFSNYLFVASMKDTDTGFITNNIKFEGSYYPYYGFFQHNPYSQSINLMLTGGVYGYKDFGLTYDQRQEYFGYFLIFDAHTFDIKSVKRFKHTAGNAYLQKQTDATHTYDGIPIHSYTNKYGITFVASEKHAMKNWGPEKVEATTLTDICLTRVDENGEEVSGVIIPKRQYIERHIFPVEVANRKTSKYFFRDVVWEGFDNQYVSFECIPVRSNRFVFFNDCLQNQNKTLKDRCETVLDFRKAEAICYKVNQNDELQRNYLFGTPAEDESRSLLIESMDFKEETKVMSSLVCVRKGKEKHLCVAWCKLQ